MHISLCLGVGEKVFELLLRAPLAAVRTPSLKKPLLCEV